MAPIKSSTKRWCKT